MGLITTLCMVGRGCLAQKENRKFFGVGVDFFRNFPAEMKQTMQTTRKKFTFVVSEPVDKVLVRWFSGLYSFVRSIVASFARIIGNSTPDLRNI